MKKTFLLLSYLFCIPFAGAQVTMTINPGSYLVAGGNGVNGQVTLNSGSFVNNGTYLDSTGKLNVRGGTTFSGTGTTNCHDLIVNNTGTTLFNSLVSVYDSTNLVLGNLNANNNLYVRSDVNNIANIVVKGALTNNVKGIISKAAVMSGGCPSFTSLLTLNISGPVVLFQWQSSSDSLTWVNIIGATLASYTATVTSTAWYRCHLTTSNSSYNESTPGVKLIFTGTYPAAITGNSAVCTGASTVLTDDSTGGNWSSSNNAITVIGSSTGILSGISAGTSSIIYTLPSGCSKSKTITVNPSPSLITGANNLCSGATIILNDSVAGGNWSSSNTAIARIGSVSGIVSGISAGTAIITYSLANGCYMVNFITVNPLPSVITGPPSICAGLSSTFIDSVALGSWTSSNTGIATVGSASGNVLGVSSGTAKITYTLGTGCYKTTSITVNPSPANITGITTICAGSTSTLSNSIVGGNWASANTSIATIGSLTGVFTGVSAGTSLITYRLGAGCNITTTITINPLPSVITGPPSICAGLSSTFIDSVALGSWTSSNTIVATVGSASGNVLGVSSGTTKITYTLGTGCYKTTTITVNPSPANITGITTICAGSTSTLSNSIGGGNWASANTSIATIGSLTGVFTGVSAGTALITYRLSAGCNTTTTVTINPLPSLIFGPTSICAGLTSTFTDSVSGGDWTSYNTGVASIDSARGIVNGISAGTAKITYTLSTGCYKTTSISINPSPSNIFGITTICAGSTSTLSNLITGGIWASGNTSIATIGSLTGVFTGVSSGTVIITYRLSAGCNTTTTVTVNSSASLITGPISICVGLSSTFTDSVSGGNWTSSNTGVASIDSVSGIVNGISAGTAKITYTLSTGCYKTTSISINPSPSNIFGITTICAGSTSTLSNLITGGIWASGNTSIATIGSLTGVFTGVSSGTVIITYRLSAGCNTTTTVTVNSSASLITGPISICVGLSSTFTDSVSGGNWTSSNTGVASIDSVSGIVLGISAGTAKITYTLGTGCYKSVLINVISMPSRISGTTLFCGGNSATLVDSISGGKWISGNAGVAIIGSATGIVSGVSTGSAIITYTLGYICSTTATVTINQVPSIITGASGFCIGTTTTLADSIAGGTWTSSNTAIATVGSLTGIVNGVTSGSAVITYSLGSGCKTTALISVISSPSLITGVTTVCSGATITLSDTTSGGTWGSGNVFVATIDSVSGLVTGVSPGSVIISYNLTCGLLTKIITVKAIPLPITGASILCQGAITTLTDATTGGTWSSSATGIAFIGSSTGIVTGISGGTATISYNNSGCASFTIITISSSTSITGASVICKGTSTRLNDSTSGGIWTSSNTGVATVNCTLGIVNGVSTGTAIITYSYGEGCTNTFPVTIITLPAISGSTKVCEGSTIILNNPATGGSWSSPGGAGIVSVGSSTGLVTGLALGNAVIDYSFGTECATSKTVTVLSLGSNTGIASVCQGLTTLLSNVTVPGTWSSGNPFVASVAPSTGVITGVSSGTAIITYAFGTACITTTSVTVNPVPFAVTVTGGGTFCNNSSIAATGGGGATIYFQGTNSNGTSTAIPSTSQIVNTTGTYYFRAQGIDGCWSQQDSASVLIPIISGPSTVCIGTTASLTNTGGTGGRWSSSNTAIGSVGQATGVYRGISAGNVTITDSLPSGCIVTTLLNTGTVPAITGPGVVCQGQTISLSNSATDGTWSSSAPTVATIGSTGIVTGIGGGLPATITYTLGASACRATFSVSVSTIAPISVTGTGTVCLGQTIPLTDATSGGTWSSSATGIVTVTTFSADSGIVTGISLGSALISYNLPSGCKTTTLITTKILSPIIGPSIVCVGQTITLVDTTLGGAWSTSSPTIAIIGSLTGIVSGIAGNLSAIMNYTLGSGCSTTYSIHVNPLEQIKTLVLDGHDTVCQGQTLALTDGIAGGSWTTNDTTIASINSSGLVSGISGGIVAITYALPTGCTTIADITVNPIVPITGPSFVCLHQTIELTDATGSGTWSSSAVTIATIGTGNGIVTGIASGLTAIMTYTSCSGCSATKSISVNPLSAISGSPGVCQGQDTTLTNADFGGTWSSSNSNAIVGSTGILTGVSEGLSVISYTLPTGCTAITTESVYPLSAIMGSDKVCVGQTIALTDIVPGGNWFSHSPTIASIGLTTGIVTGVAAGYGPTTITYTLSTGCKATLEMSVNANPTAPGTITGPSIVSISGSPITLVCSPTGGTWSSSNNSKAIVDSGTGIVTGISIGTVIISYTETNSAGCSTYATKNITVGASPASTDEGITLYKAANEINKNEIALLPNPNNGDFRLNGTLGSITDEELSIEVVNMLGQLVYSTKSRTINREINEQIWLNNSLFNGMYILYLKTSTRNLMFHFVVLQ